MNWISLVIAVISLAKEILKYQAKRDLAKTDKVKQVKDFKNALKKARVDNDTTDLEQSFYAALNPNSGKLPSNKE